MSATTRVAAKANATGDATFDFPTVPSGTSRVGTVVVPLATAGAKSIVAITGQDFCALLGGGGGGPVPVRGSGRLTVTTTGLLSTVTYTAVFNYVQHTGSTTPPATAVLAPATAFSETTFTGNVTAKITGPVTVEPKTGSTFNMTGTVTFPSAQDVQFPSAQDINLSASAITLDVAAINKATTVLQTGDAFKLLLSKGQTSQNPSFTITATLLTVPYSALLVRVQTAAAATVYCVTVNPEFSTDTTPPLLIQPAQFTAPFGPLLRSTTTSIWQAIVPITSRENELSVDIYTSASHAYTVDILGLTSNPGVQLRSDGRTYPIGAFTLSSTAGTGAIVAAPSSPLRIMVRNLSLGVWTNDGIEGLIAYNGNSTTGRLLLTMGDANGSVISQSWDSGVLLPAGTALEAVSFHEGTTATSTIFSTTLTYDLVV